LQVNLAEAVGVQRVAQPEDGRSQVGIAGATLRSPHYGAANEAASVKAFLTLHLFRSPGQAQDGFEAVKWGAAVARAAIGKHPSREPAEKVEARLAELGLKDRGIITMAGGP
jgi:hypothetical protein